MEKEFNKNALARAATPTGARNLETSKSQGYREKYGEMTMNGNTKDVNYQPLASEIITDLQKENEKLKAELKEACERADCTEKDWEFVLGQREILNKRIEIIDFTLRIDDYKCLEMARNFVRAAYNQQPKESEEEE